MWTSSNPGRDTLCPRKGRWRYLLENNRKQTLPVSVIPLFPEPSDTLNWEKEPPGFLLLFFSKLPTKDALPPSVYVSPWKRLLCARLRLFTASLQYVYSWMFVCLFLRICPSVYSVRPLISVANSTAKNSVQTHSEQHVVQQLLWRCTVSSLHLCCLLWNFIYCRWWRTIKHHLAANISLQVLTQTVRFRSELWLCHSNMLSM